MSEGHVAFEYEAKNVSPQTLATLGEGHIAYVKQIRSEDVPGLFPPAIHPSRHRRAPLPAHLCAGGGDARAGCGPEERAVVHRPRQAGT